MPSKTTDMHKKKSPKTVKIAVITVSDSKYTYHWTGQKGPETEDRSGKSIIDRIKKEGHMLSFYCIIPDHAGMILETVDHIVKTFMPDSIIITGGTGLGPRDVTIEAMETSFDKTISGFGELFRIESRKEIGNAAMLSRATAGVYENAIVFCLPGSPNACETGMNIIFEELGHLVKHSREGMA